jgi:hypothetical protein
LRIPIGVIKEGERNPEHWIALTGAVGTEFCQSVDIDSQRGNYHVGYLSGDRELILKYNNQGVSQFKKRIQTSGINQEFLNLAKIDPSGSLGVVGDSNDGTQFLGSLAKYTSAGLYQWKRLFPSLLLNALVSDSSNNFYICGSVGFNRGYLAKVNSSGVVQWQRGFGINPVPDTNILLYSASLDNAEDLVLSGTRNIVNVPDQATGILVKYNSLGSLLWQKQISGTGGINFRKTVIDANGNIYVLGYRARLDVPSGFLQHPLLIKFNSLGQIQWQRVISPEFYSNPRDLAIGPDSSLYISQDWSLQGLPGGVVISKIQPSGSIEWQRRINEPGVPGPSSATLAVSGENLYVSLHRGFNLPLNPDIELLSISMPTGENNYGSYNIGSTKIVIEPIETEFIASSFSEATPSFTSGAESISNFTPASVSVTDLSFTDFKTNF